MQKRENLWRVNNGRKTLTPPVDVATNMFVLIAAGPCNSMTCATATKPTGATLVGRATVQGSPPWPRCDQKNNQQEQNNKAQKWRKEKQ